MLMFAQLGRGALLPARIEAGSAGLSAYAVRAADDSIRICLINKETQGAVRVSIVPGRRIAGASLLRLSGPAIDATAGITLGGAPVDDTGQWTPARRESLNPADGKLAVELPAASAVFVELRA